MREALGGREVGVGWGGSCVLVNEQMNLKKKKKKADTKEYILYTAGFSNEQNW